MVADHTDIQLAPLDELFDDCVGAEALVDELYTLNELGVVADHRGLRDAD